MLGQEVRPVVGVEFGGGFAHVVGRVGGDDGNQEMAAHNTAWAAAQAAGNMLAWRDSKLAEVPRQWRKWALKKHDQLGGIWSQAANHWAHEITGRMRALRVPVTVSDTELIELSERCAREALNLASGPVVYDLAGYRNRLERYCYGYAVEPPAGNIKDDGAVKRMTDALWWRRRLRTAQGRAVEGEAIALGFVHRRAQVYASDVAVERRAGQRARNAALLAAMDAVNLDTGEVARLDEMVARSVANPSIRRGELMARIAGFEAVANGLGHVGEFVTLTTPSQYHAKRTGANGKPEDNPKWNKQTPKQAQGYLCRIWQRMRAKLARLGVRPYGFRIAEPHHDGTPHWHMLLFVASECVAAFREVVSRYALALDGNESGAQDNRVKFVSIEPGKGTAAGYIAKYIAKNIDAFSVQGALDHDGAGDVFGLGIDAVTSSQRVDAWASTWGIRQFQQVGGPPVGVWRELRRMREASPEHGPDLEAARAAADAGNWRRYVEVQGGPVVERKCLPLRVAYTRAGCRYSVEGGEVPAPNNRYGEMAKPAVYGVVEVKRARAHVSRVHRWVIRRGGIRSGAECAATATLGSEGVAAGASPRDFEGVAFDFRAGSSAPWTRVNNCTEGGGDGAKDQDEFGGMDGETGNRGHACPCSGAGGAVCRACSRGAARNGRGIVGAGGSA